ncbi:MAG: VanZ family protein [Coriobacteriales bacterium]|nr:VanZ family protein [Coriobacteriales bacterium]
MSKERSGARAFIHEHSKAIQWALVILCALGIFIASSFPASTLPDAHEHLYEFAHFCEYWLLATLLVGALDVPGKRTGYKVAILAILICSLYGLTDEFHQMFVPGRVPDRTDWIIDTLGGIVGGMAGVWALTVWRLWHE